MWSCMCLDSICYMYIARAWLIFHLHVHVCVQYTNHLVPVVWPTCIVLPCAHVRVSILISTTCTNLCICNVHVQVTVYDFVLNHKYKSRCTCMFECVNVCVCLCDIPNVHVDVHVHVWRVPYLYFNFICFHNGRGDKGMGWYIYIPQVGSRVWLSVGVIGLMREGGGVRQGRLQ